jgi:hypothetical protein
MVRGEPLRLCMQRSEGMSRKVALGRSDPDFPSKSRTRILYIFSYTKEVEDEI